MHVTKKSAIKVYMLDQMPPGRVLTEKAIRRRAVESATSLILFPFCVLRTPICISVADTIVSTMLSMSFL